MLLDSRQEFLFTHALSPIIFARIVGLYIIGSIPATAPGSQIPRQVRVVSDSHRNNRHRMRAPIFSQSKICLHKMAHSKGHFYSVQTPVARNFARLRGVRLFFSNTVFFKSLKTRKIRLVKKISLSKIHPSGFFKKRISFGRKIYSKIQCQGCCEGKTKLKG